MKEILMQYKQEIKNFYINIFKLEKLDREIAILLIKNHSIFVNIIKDEKDMNSYLPILLNGGFIFDVEELANTKIHLSFYKDNLEITNRLIGTMRSVTDIEFLAKAMTQLADFSYIPNSHRDYILRKIDDYLQEERLALRLPALVLLYSDPSLLNYLEKTSLDLYISVTSFERKIVLLKWLYLLVSIGGFDFRVHIKEELEYSLKDEDKFEKFLAAEILSLEIDKSS